MDGFTYTDLIAKRKAGETLSHAELGFISCCISTVTSEWKISRTEFNDSQKTRSLIHARLLDNDQRALLPEGRKHHTWEYYLDYSISKYGANSLVTDFVIYMCNRSVIDREIPTQHDRMVRLLKLVDDGKEPQKQDFMNSWKSDD